ncbi:uncharacterized protein A1O9_02792 [Exophiala aquamarina CBS 119918]|uniref:C3H1-type domain-containing protein n=1 Tax=Exophiala aquamarina CBS 119918 TaxID=1182545 RepID=A0A072PNA5_9EURO|nr:uncharacterized protein A1O9_02792 [Exophiala aquamarina CBS 119918]KEF61227.1 hypothetical protein A1O9_02792 [Exophiala aquamarina CBS 119918]
MSKALTAEPASHLHMNDEDHDAAKIQSSQGDLYKLITCHYWKQGRCNLYENHCLFAHVETGQESPSGRNPAKAFTCPTWKAHHCGKSSDECLYSHEDTGLYVGFNNDVLRKHITCYYWKVSGSCRHYEQDCSYAHRDTGILAWQPAKDAQSAPGKNSLKNYMCPRWESNQTCMWYPINCPYNHSPTALSCHRSATESRRNVRQVEHSPDWESEPVLGPSPSTYVSQVMPPFSMDGVKERKNKHRDAQKDETCTAVAGVQLHTPAIAPGASRITPTRDDPPAIRHHPFTGRHMAKRGGRTVRNLPSKQSSGTALNNSLRSPSQDQHNQHNSSIRDSASTWPGTPDFSGTAGDTSAKSLAGNRVKKCEKCERRILGSANRCFSCATTDATHNEDDSRALGGRSNAVDLELSDLAIPKVFPAQKMSQNEYGFDESSRRLVARVLKRAAQDDDLFVSRKRLKISTLPMNSQTALSTRTSASRPQSPAKVGIAQSSATEIPKTPSSGRLPPTSLSKSTSAMEKGNAQSLEKTQAPGELHAEFFESDNQPHDARTSRALVSDDNHWQDESVKSAAKHRVNSSAKSAEANRCYWLKIKQAASLHHQASNSLSVSKYREKALKVAVALGVTETSDESMVDAIEYVAAETGPIGRFASKVNLTPRLNSEHPRLRSRARAAAIEDPLRDSGGDSNDDLPLAIIRRRNRPKDHRSSLEHAAMPVTLTLGNSNEQGNRLDPFAKRPTGTRHPRPQHGKARPGWTDDEEQRALERLRERGVKIETDSDSDELLSDDDAPRQAPALVTDRLHRVLESQNPFDVDSSLDLRNPENRYQALGKIPPWNRNRPTKKQLMGNLLLYQCRDNKLKFGNPHYNVMRKSREVLVNAIIEKDDVLNSPDECSGREPEIQQVPMTFREFIGMPKQATITRGKSKDELTFVERLNHTDRSLLGASTRTRRYRDDEVFPFIKG